LGWAKIRHPFHPLRGQSFLILKKLRIAGVDTLVVRGAEGSSFQVAREWTDHGDPYPYEMLLDVSPLRFDVDLLLELVDLLEQVAPASPKSYLKEIDK
jgi:hypothetical protein